LVQGGSVFIEIHFGASSSQTIFNRTLVKNPGAFKPFQPPDGEQRGRIHDEAVTMLRFFIVCSALLASLPANAQSFRGGTEQDYRDIQRFHDDSVARNNTGDVSGAVADYLPRLRVLNTKSRTIKGRDALQASWTAGAQSDKRGVLISEIEEMEVNGNNIGDWAYMICRYAYVAVDRETGAVASDYEDGRYLALLEKTSDGWKVLLDIDNGAAGAAPDLIDQLRLKVKP
jgi:ketosteroid isomerase-like protein